MSWWRCSVHAELFFLFNFILNRCQCRCCCWTHDILLSVLSLTWVSLTKHRRVKERSAATWCQVKSCSITTTDSSCSLTKFSTSSAFSFGCEKREGEWLRVEKLVFKGRGVEGKLRERSVKGRHKIRMRREWRDDCAKRDKTSVMSWVKSGEWETKIVTERH